MLQNMQKKLEKLGAANERAESEGLVCDKESES